MPGKFYGQRSLEGYSPWGCKELDTTEQLSTAHNYSKLAINTLEGNNSRITEAEEWISELKDRMVKTTAEKQNKKGRNK